MKSPFGRDCATKSIATTNLAHPLLARCGCSLPSGGDAQNPFHRLLQRGDRGCEGEADEMSTSRPESRAGDGRDPSLFEHDATQLFGTHSGLRNVHPGIKCACGRRAAESGNATQVADELSAPLSKLADHARRRGFA